MCGIEMLSAHQHKGFCSWSTAGAEGHADNSESLQITISLILPASTHRLSPSRSRGQMRKVFLRTRWISTRSEAAQERAPLAQ